MTTNTKLIAEITAEEFAQSRKLSLAYANGMAEDFITTRIGRIVYAVSTKYGYAYTRPQLIAKYRNVEAAYEIGPFLG